MFEEHMFWGHHGLFLTTDYDIWFLECCSGQLVFRLLYLSSITIIYATINLLLTLYLKL